MSAATPESRLSIAWFSPLPDQPGAASSISVYWSSVFVPLLLANHQITIFADTPRRSSAWGAPVEHYLAAAKLHERSPFDLFLYQLEDSRITAPARMHLGLIPGLTIVHDLLLTDDGPDPFTNSPWERTAALARSAALHGEAPALFAARGTEFPRPRPLAVREVGLSLACLFSAPWAHAESRRASLAHLTPSKTPSYYLPHPLSEVETVRSTQDLFTVAVIGGPRIERRSHQLVHALLAARVPRVRWLIAPEDRAAAESLIADLGPQKVTQFELIEGVSVAQWRQVASQSSVAIHTLFSVFGQMGPYLDISASLGVPCVVSDFGGSEYLPKSVFFSIPPGEHERAELTQLLFELQQRDLTTLRDQLRRWAAERGTALELAGELDWVIRRVVAQSAATQAGWRKVESLARGAILAEASSLLADPTPFETQALFSEQYQELGFR